MAKAKSVLAVLLQIMKIDDLLTVDIPQITCIASIDNAGSNQKRSNIIYKWKPAEINTVEYDTVILNF